MQNIHANVCCFDDACKSWCCWPFEDAQSASHAPEAIPSQEPWWNACADPYKPPAISMFTPSGRFKTNTQLCMSMTNYHPESWNPMWSVGTILNGLLSFMQESAISTGSISTSREMRQQLAQESLQWNATNLTFKKLFPDYMELAASQAKQAAGSGSQAQSDAQAASAEAGTNSESSTQQTNGGTHPDVPRHPAASLQVAFGHLPGGRCALSTLFFIFHAPRLTPERICRLVKYILLMVQVNAGSRLGCLWTLILHDHQLADTDWIMHHAVKQNIAGNC